MTTIKERLELLEDALGFPLDVVHLTTEQAEVLGIQRGTTPIFIGATRIEFIPAPTGVTSGVAHETALPTTTQPID